MPETMTTHITQLCNSTRSIKKMIGPLMKEVNEDYRRALNKIMLFHLVRSGLEFPITI
jgi:hypothetical protein